MVLLPSQGLGGGIEQYYAGLRDAWPRGTNTVEFPLRTQSSAGTVAQVRFVIRVLAFACRHRGDVAGIACFHPNLLALSWLASKLSRSATPAACFYYGSDIWGSPRRTRVLWRRLCHQPVTISSFSAGALMIALNRPPVVIMPMFATSRRTALEGAPVPVTADPVIRVLSVFRLNDAEEKGAYRLADAVAKARQCGGEIHLLLAGSGQPPDRLQALADRHSWLEIQTNLDEQALAAAYRSSDIFVLATAMRGRPQPNGEGYGIVLVEAARAGLPVIAPALGGSYDAMVEGWNGLVPVDESADALCAELLRLARDTDLRQRFAARSVEWTADRFDDSATLRTTALLAKMLGVAERFDETPEPGPIECAPAESRQ